MEEIERLLAQAEQDAEEASDEAMRLTVEFGDDPLLLEFIATANQFKANIRTSQARLNQLRQEVPSSSRNIRIQLLLAQVTSTRTSVGRFRERVLEIGRND